MTNKELQNKLRKINCELRSLLWNATEEQKEFYGIESISGGASMSNGHAIYDSYCIRYTLVSDDERYKELLEENKKY